MLNLSHSMIEFIPWVHPLLAEPLPDFDLAILAHTDVCPVPICNLYRHLVRVPLNFVGAGPLSHVATESSHTSGLRPG